jgi:integrase/recombinase XerD
MMSNRYRRQSPRPWKPVVSQRQYTKNVISRASAPYRRVLGGFARWLEDDWRLALGTITVRVGSAKSFLEAVCPGKGSCIAGIRKVRVDDVEAFFVAYCKDHGWAARRSMQSALRLLFRFATASRWCSPELVDAVPHLRTYRLSGVPRGIGEAALGKLLRALAAEDDHARDRAIILALACYGVRRGQVSLLQLDDIDWRARTIRFQAHKAGKMVRHALTPAVAAALARYLRQERPPSTSGNVFLRMRRPYLPLSPSAVTGVVRQWLIRLGVTVSPRGPHALRHAFAARLLRAGQSLKAIADLLGHRSLSATSVYAKVDYVRLLEVAAEWPEVLS